MAAPSTEAIKSRIRHAASQILATCRKNAGPKLYTELERFQSGTEETRFEIAIITSQAEEDHLEAVINKKAQPIALRLLADMIQDERWAKNVMPERDRLSQRYNKYDVKVFLIARTVSRKASPTEPSFTEPARAAHAGGVPSSLGAAAATPLQASPSKTSTRLTAKDILFLKCLGIKPEDLG